jgi:serine/threonine protein phosphatase PrpC
VHRLGRQDVCIIAATDGVWEAMSAGTAVREVCDAMADGLPVNAAAAALCREAVSTAADKFGTRPDNTTAALIVFDEILEESAESSLDEQHPAAVQNI